MESLQKKDVLGGPLSPQPNFWVRGAIIYILVWALKE